ncbi:MAG: hypothetical protein MZW92_46960 [Comamonadaceae bacterium]|nr:hypothetical protein [Comamonadaceae bacterium]
MLYSSLMVENRQRQAHMDRALQNTGRGHRTAQARPQHPAPGGNHRGDRGDPAVGRNARAAAGAGR